MTLVSALRSWLDLREGEGRSTLLMALHSFFMGISTVFFETAANALFLHHFQSDILPYVYLAAAFASIVAGLLYTKLRELVSFAPLMLGTLIFLLLMVVFLRVGLSFSEAGWLLFGLMIAYRLLSIMTDLEYWAVAVRLHDVRQSKRLFSLIGTGEVTARIIGSFSVPILVVLMGVSDLFWISGLGLFLCLLLLITIFRIFPHIALRSDEPGDNNFGEDSNKAQSLSSLFANRYLQLIFLLAFFAVLGKYFVDFAFLTQMQTRLSEVARLATFFAVFSGITQAINFVIRLFLSGRILNRFGVGVGLLVLPAIHFVCTIVIVVAAGIPAPAAVFWLVISNQGIYKTLKHPIDNPSFKILYQPLPRKQQLAMQIAVEVIVTPLAIAFAAVLMLSIGTLAGSSLLAYVMLANFAAWTGAAFFAFREYGGALLQALKKRSLDRASFALGDEKSIALVRSKLASGHPVDVIFALDLLQRVEHPALIQHWVELLDHDSPDVRRYVLLQIERLHPPSISAAVSSAAEREETPEVKAAALRALCAFGDPASLKQAESYLDDPRPLVRRGVLIGLLQQREGEFPERAQARLKELIDSGTVEDRVVAAQVIAELDGQQTDALMKLLQDGDSTVQRVALTAASKSSDQSVHHLLVRLLGEPGMRNEASRALLGAGAKALPELSAVLEKGDLSPTIRAQVARLIGRMGSEESLSILWKTYDRAEKTVRHAALEALDSIEHRLRDEEVDSLETRIEGEVKDAAWKLAVLRDLEGEPHLQALVVSLEKEIAQNRERVFLLLAFRYDRHKILSARDNLMDRSREKRAWAAEILDVSLSTEMKALALPLLEHLQQGERLERLEARFRQRRLTPSARVEELLSRSNHWIGDWTRACALYGAAKLKAKDRQTKLAFWSGSQIPLIAETSTWALRKNKRSPKTGVYRMLTIEKVILLKGVGVFATTSEEILADVAPILEKVDLDPGELVFEKGDVGDSMYIIVSGRVRVFDGAKTINYLEEREIFGELAILDPQPRSASVEAAEDTCLFRLDRETFFELMADNVGVVSGIMQVLCQRLRRMTAIAMGEG